jgi:phosphatidylinositol kinase/protein kinase (PI-3  family)
MMLAWRKARYNFAMSLAGYSLLCYILQIKDRHNANILIDREGHLVHIDFDFLISNSPGGNMLFERAPFKFTQEFMDVMNGEKSKCFKMYRKLMTRGFMALQKEYRKIMILIEMMLSVNKKLPCFVGGPSIIPDLKARLFPHIRGVNEEYPCLNIEEADRFIGE